MNIMPSPAAVVPTGNYGATRFNAMQHGVLSRYTVLPWEDRSEYQALLDALVAEHAPHGPTEEHLVEELAGIIWRKRRLRLAEYASATAGTGWQPIEWFWHFDRLGRRCHGKQFASTRNTGLARGTGEQAVVADAVEAMWQDMEQEAADELVRRERHDAPPGAEPKIGSTQEGNMPSNQIA